MDQTHTSLSPPGAISTSPVHEQHIRLACQACQRKKIKCDRHYPCGQCSRSSLQCIASQRKPRTRHAGKRAIDGELRTRISKLESLVESLSGEVAQSNGTNGDGADLQRKGSTDDSSSAVGKYIGSPFWSSLTTEVAALRDCLEDEHLEEDAETNGYDGHHDPTSRNPEAQNDVNPLDYDLILCPPGRLFVVPGALVEPSPEASQYLLDAFLANVDPMFKVLHAPTLRTFMEKRTSYLGKEYDAPCNVALRRTVWFAAVSSLQDHICFSHFGQSRMEMLNHYRRLVGVSLVQADIIITTDLATLQALVTYLASSKITDTTSRVWTMMALVVRIARAMGLHHETPGQSPFILEIKRRLWHQIRVLDSFCGVDRGTEPIVQNGSWDTPLPTHVNDADFGASSTSIVPREKEITDITFALMAQSGATAVMQLNTPENAPSGETWEKRQQLVKEFEQNIHGRFLQYCDPQKAFHRFVRAVGDSCCSSMMLRAVRPMQRHLSSVPPRVDSPYVLQIATDNLRMSEHVWEDPEAEQWRWMVWVQWHAIAVALAGLCSIRGTELAERAWHYVNTAYARSSIHVADTKDGMLWRPIEKLYRKAAAFRNASPAAVTQHSQGPLQSIRQSEQNSGSQIDLNFGPPSCPLPPLSYPQMGNGAPAGTTADSGETTFNRSYGIGNGFDGLSPSQIDASWLDWETIMNDLPFGNDGLGNLGDLGDMQWMDTSSGLNPGAVFS